MGPDHARTMDLHSPLQAPCHVDPQPMLELHQAQSRPAQVVAGRADGAVNAVVHGAPP